MRRKFLRLKQQRQNHDSPSKAPVGVTAPDRLSSRRHEAGTKIGEGRVEATVPMLFSADETTDLGKDNHPRSELSAVHGTSRL